MRQTSRNPKDACRINDALLDEGAIQKIQYGNWFQCTVAVRRVQDQTAPYRMQYSLVKSAGRAVPKEPTSEWSTVVLLASLCLLVWAGCERREGPSVAAPASDERRPTQVTSNPRVVLHEGRRQRAVLKAKQMAQYETPDSSYAVLHTPATARDTARSNSMRVHVQLFTPAGDSSATIAADSLLYFSDEGRADAYGDVVVRTPEGRQLYSEHVVWRQSDRKVRSSRFVRIVTPTETLNGQGLLADEDLSSYQIGRFDAEVDLDENDAPPRAAADSS